MKHMTDRIRDYLFDSSRNVKDRTFVLFSASMIGALTLAMITGIILREPLSSTLVSLSVILICVILLAYAVKRDAIKRAKIVVAFFAVFVFMPFMFFTKGGMLAGGPMTLLLGSYYLVLVLDGKFRVIMCIINAVILGVCMGISYMIPGTVIEFSEGSDFVYSVAKFFITWAMLTVLITFWTRIIQKEKKTAEEQSKQLEELNRSQNRFFSSMSHEIRTPINTVLGLNEIILRQEDASEEIRKDARNIQGAGKMLLALINDILDISKIEAGKMDIVPVNYDVAALISEIVNMIWLKAEEKGLKFHVDIDPNVPATLFGDEVRIKQILINLLNNAVKYTKEGSVSLHMECESSDADEVLLKINVSDTGMGIKPDALPHLFDSFQRLDEEENRYIEGTGLGLSIVKQLVEMMDGQITVNSVYTEGTTFALALKQKVSSDKLIGDINLQNEGMSGSDRFEHSFVAPTAAILIVDDNEMNLQVEQKLLSGTGMRIDTALSGQDALALTLRNRYDAIFMDHLMPEMNGIECFEQIREQKGGLNQDIPIIVLTANAGGENIELYNNTGFDGYLVKPVSGRQLEDMLLEHLPSEKIEMSRAGELRGARINTASGYSKKKPVVIATSTMSDLPQSVIKKMQIDIIPYTVITNEGVFYDNIDIDADELVAYMSDKSRMVDSEPPTEEALTAFFAKELSRAHQLIYITLTTGSSREYGRAVNVAKSFENVTVVNSECLSSGTGILVMIAARLAAQGMQVDKIISELEIAKGLIRTSFVVSNTDIMARRNRITPFMNSVLNSFWLRPLLRVKNDKLGVGKLVMGDERKCFEKYIDYALPSNVYPDTTFAFITYAGMTEEDLLWFEEKVRARMKFDNIIFQKASAGISSNCGGGTVGLIYIIKGDHNYNLGSYFAKIKADTDEEETEETPEETPEEPSGIEETVEEKPGNVVWYRNVPGINADAAIKNSGNEEAFLSVLKIYYETFGVRSGEIRGFFDSRDWENYTIKVHALKSSSRLVGALKIGDDAEALEMAGKRGDIGYITENHDALFKEYRAIRDELAPFFASKDDLPDIPADVLEDAYSSIAEFAENMDYQLTSMVMDSVAEYKLPPDDAQRFDEIKKKMSVLDWDGIRDIINGRGH